MRALLCTELGPPEMLILDDVPDPAPGPGEVVIDVRAAGLNFPDMLIIEGKYQVRPDLPFSPGNEAAGVVADVGDGADLPLGTEVMAVAPTIGAFADKWAVPTAAVMPKPSPFTFEQAAGFGLTYGTSYHALKQRAELHEGETLLVLGAAGGVGSAAVQIGKAMGARVIAAAGSKEKLEFCIEMGTDETINYREEDLKEAARRLTDGRGADVVYDAVGGDLAEPAFRATAWEGRYLVIGFAAGDIPRLPLNLPLLKGSSVVGVFWGGWVARDPAASAQNYRELFDMVSAGTLTPPPPTTYPLTDYVSAFSAIAERRAIGKIVLTMG